MDPANIASACFARVVDAGVNQADAVTATFQAFVVMGIDEFTAVLVDEAQCRAQSRRAPAKKIRRGLCVRRHLDCSDGHQDR